tara:strand:+ start:1457 stop:2686 length:1230 start_codon:yes stop_codon:yes gene_type:complete
MLGLNPLASSTLADVGAKSLPIAQISGVEATGEVTNQPIAFQPVTVAISGVSGTVTGAESINIMIGSFYTVFALNLTAELEPLPLTGLTRLMLIDSAGELTAENGVAGVPTSASISGVQNAISVGAAIASVPISSDISGLEIAAATTAVSVIVNQHIDVDGFGLLLELENLANNPHSQAVTGFDFLAETEALGNLPHSQLISGLQTILEVEDLDNTPINTNLSSVEILIELESLDNTSVIQVLPSVEILIELEGLDNTSVIQVLPSVFCAAQLDPVDNRPGNATSISGVQAEGQTETVATAHGCGIQLADVECLASAGNVIVSIAQRQTILGVQAVQELSNLEAIFIAYPISIDISGVQAVTALGTVQLIEVVRVPFAKSLPAGLSNFVFLSPANANFAIVDNKINRLG